MSYIICPRCGGKLELHVDHDSKVTYVTKTGIKYTIRKTSYHCYECDLTM